MSSKTEKLKLILSEKMLKENRTLSKNKEKSSKIWKPELKEPIQKQIEKSETKISTYEEILKLVDNL